MELLREVIEVLLHLDTHLQWVLAMYGVWTYAILFLTIFCETGFVITPFLPGDSLLFAAGTFAGLGLLDPWILALLLSIAAIVGDSVNYTIGRHSGPWVFRYETHLLFRREYLERTRTFYQAHGRKTIVFARFVPIVRTFAPFIAGIGHMHYPTFLLYNIAGGILWVSLFVFGGFLFGNLPLIHENFTLVIFGIIGVSFLPGVVEYIRKKWSLHPPPFKGEGKGEGV